MAEAAADPLVKAVLETFPMAKINKITDVVPEVLERENDEDQGSENEA